MAEISIIIVSYNTKKLTAQAITSVLGAGEIIVVDNDSRDGSPEYLDNIFGKKNRILKRRDNGGFAKANNEGIKVATGTYIVLLNSDTIVHGDALKHMRDAMDADPKLGLLSCRLLNEDGSYQPQGGALPTLLNIAAWWLWPLPGNIPGIEAYQARQEVLRFSGEARRTQDDLVREVGWIGGTAMMIRRELIEKIGMLDEKIFMYAEDTDYCIRAQKAGYTIGIEPTGEITHLGSKSAGSHNALAGEVKGLIYLWGKHFPGWQRPLIRLIFLKGAVLRYILFGILGRDERARTLYARITKASLA